MATVKPAELEHDADRRKSVSTELYELGSRSNLDDNSAVSQGALYKTVAQALDARSVVKFAALVTTWGLSRIRITPR